MTHRLSETYRGCHVLIEAVSDDGHGMRLHRTITRQLGARLVVVEEHSGPCLAASALVNEAMTDALRDARETVNRLLGGWHPVYTQSACAETLLAR